MIKTAYKVPESGTISFMFKDAVCLRVETHNNKLIYYYLFILNIYLVSFSSFSFPHRGIPW